MELKFGSVWLLLSCSLQQSLWGILASVPQTNAKKCTHKISDTGEVRKVQMMKRIPARCSGWDEAWSWLSQKDCRTKYKMDYMELPRAVQKVEDKDCEPSSEEAAASESENYFNVSDEKFLAIAFGSATVALLILILIIVVSLVRRGQMCTTCCTRPSYATANATDGDVTEETHPCNAYVEEGLKLMESEYEEIMDPSTREKKLTLQGEEKGNQNLPLYPSDELRAIEGSSGTVIPSAPYEEDLRQTNLKSVPNDYSAFISDGTNGRVMHDGLGETVSRFTPVGKDLIERSSKQQCSSIPVDGVGCDTSHRYALSDIGNDESSSVLNTADNTSELIKGTIQACDEVKGDNQSKDFDSTHKNKTQNEYSTFDDLINSSNGAKDGEEAESFTDYEEPLSAPISSHSYENLDPSTQESNENTTVYDSLTQQSPVYCEPKTVARGTNDTDSSPLQSHVTMNGFHCEDSGQVLTGSKKQTLQETSLVQKEPKSMVYNGINNT